MRAVTLLKVLILVGLPGSGKSSWAGRERIPVLSSDEIRRLLSDSETDQSIHKQVFATLRSLLRLRLDLKRPLTAIDATNLTPRERRPYIRIAHAHGASVEAVFFNVPLETCLARNAGRARVVPEHAIHAMANKLVPPSAGEGFSRIRLVPAPKRQSKR
jgi:predicted kinase